MSFTKKMTFFAPNCYNKTEDKEKGIDTLGIDWNGGWHIQEMLPTENDNCYASTD